MKKLGAILIGLGLALSPAAAHADHEYDDDWGRGGDGGYSEGHQGYGGGGGRSGDMEQGDGRNCRNFCDNTIIVPTPGERGGDENRR